MDHDDDNDVPSLQAFLELLENDDGWEKDFDDDAVDWEQDDKGNNLLASCTFSALEVVLMMRADKATVEKVYQMNPKALTSQVLRNACRHGVSSVGFLASKLGEEDLAEEDEEDGRLAVHLAMEPGPGPNRPSELDVLDLVKGYPECIVEPDPWGGLEPWATALRWRYEPSILRFFFETLAEHISADEDLILDEGIQYGKEDNDLICRAIDKECAKAMSAVFHKIKGFETFGLEWTVDGLALCLQQLLEKPKIQYLDLDVRLHKQEEDDETGQGLILDGQLATQHQTLVSRASVSNVEKLYLHFRDPPNNPFFPCLLDDVALHLPRLQRLEIHVGRELRPAVPLLAQLLQTSTTLQGLRIMTSEDPKGELLPVLDAIATNTVLKNFHYLEDGLTLSSNEGCRGYLAVCLMTSNTTLESVQIGASGEEQSQSHATKTIDYYALLNKWGRGMARSRHTRLPEFVDLLAAPTPETTQHTTDAHNIQFGLLREAPTLWSSVFVD